MPRIFFDVILTGCLQLGFLHSCECIEIGWLNLFFFLATLDALGASGCPLSLPFFMRAVAAVARCAHVLCADFFYASTPLSAPRFPHQCRRYFLRHLEVKPSFEDLCSAKETHFCTAKTSSLFSLFLAIKSWKRDIRKKHYFLSHFDGLDHLPFGTEN